MTDKELIKDVLELLQLIHTSRHTLLPTNPPTDPWVYHKVSWKIEDMARRLNNKLRAETEQPTTRKLGFDDALKIAHGCFDYMGGYRDDNLYIYHHGIQTVVNCLESAKEKGLKDSQIRAVHIIGTEEIERQMKHEQEAVFWWRYTNAQGKTVVVGSSVKPYDDAVPLFTSEPHPTDPDKMVYGSRQYDLPQRTWVGLTDEEVSQLIGNEIGFNSCCGWEDKYTRAVEAKIKELNT